MDNSILKSDIFFFVTTVVTAVVGALLVIGLFYVLRILHIVKNITKKAEAGANTVVEGLSEAKSAMQEDGYIIANLFEIFKKVATHKKKRTKTK